jgi:hypothetical protein
MSSQVPTSADPRGQPIVYRFPENTAQDFVQRVIALGGERVELRGGHSWINGWEVPHCTLGRGTLPDDSRSIEGEVILEYLEGETYLTFLDARSPMREASGPWIVTGYQSGTRTPD